MPKYEIVHDKVRKQNGDIRQWLVYVDDVLRAECTNKQAACDFVAIEKDKMTKNGGSHGAFAS